MNISEVIKDVRSVVNNKRFKAREDVRNILLRNCKRISEEYNPFDGELKSLYLKGPAFIVFKEETTYYKRKTHRLHKAYKIKIIGPYREQLYYANVLGPVIV